MSANVRLGWPVIVLIGTLGCAEDEPPPPPPECVPVAMLVAGESDSVGIGNATSLATDFSVYATPSDLVLPYRSNGNLEVIRYQTEGAITWPPLEVNRTTGVLLDDPEGLLTLDIHPIPSDTGLRFPYIDSEGEVFILEVSAEPLALTSGTSGVPLHFDGGTLLSRLLVPDELILIDAEVAGIEVYGLSGPTATWLYSIPDMVLHDVMHTAAVGSTFAVAGWEAGNDAPLQLWLRDRSTGAEVAQLLLEPGHGGSRTKDFILHAFEDSYLILWPRLEGRGVEVWYAMVGEDGTEWVAPTLLWSHDFDDPTSWLDVRPAGTAWTGSQLVVTWSAVSEVFHEHRVIAIAMLADGVTVGQPLEVASRTSDVGTTALLHSGEDLVVTWMADTSAAIEGVAITVDCAD